MSLGVGESRSQFVLSLVRDDPAFRIQRRLGLIPAEGFGVARRALFWALLGWVPVALWAWYLATDGGPIADEPLLAHFGVQSRLLIAVPLLIFAEGVAHGLTTRLLPHFVDSGLIGEAEVARFRTTLQGVAKLRDRSLPWIAIVAVGVGLSTITEVVHQSHEVAWAVSGGAGQGRLGFGAWWFLYCARPIYLAFVFAWLWRVVLVGTLLSRIAKLDLSIVPTHPDRAGGLGFLEKVPTMFAPVVLAIGIVLASRWAHDVVYHDVDVRSLRLQMGGFVVISVLLFSSPLLAFVPVMMRAKRKALLDYAALVGNHGRLVRNRWILKQPVTDDGLLNAPELGPLADTGPAYDAVVAMRVLLLGRASVLPLLVAALIPVVAVLAIEVPIAQILSTLAKALI